MLDQIKNFIFLHFPTRCTFCERFVLIKNVLFMNYDLDKLKQCIDEDNPDALTVRKFCINCAVKYIEDGGIA